MEASGGIDTSTDEGFYGVLKTLANGNINPLTTMVAESRVESDSSDDAFRIWTDDFVAGVLSAVVVICVLSIYLWVL